MAKKQSAGIVLYRIMKNGPEVFLVHPGGPYWSKKDKGAWSIPKGEFKEGDDPLQAAKREFNEETGFSVCGEFRPMRPLRQPGGKLIHAWAVEGNIDASEVKSNVFSLEWPPCSGIIRQFPEVDKGEWFAITDAMEKLLPGQRPFLEQLLKSLA
jgi:predicted NUDIX family NTP pyrophosphohydrolase